MRGEEEGEWAQTAWMHHVLTYNYTSKAVRHYLNGALQHSVTLGRDFSTGYYVSIDTMMRLGVHWGDMDGGAEISRAFKGWMADARIYAGRVFTAGEVAALWEIYAGRI